MIPFRKRAAAMDPEEPLEVRKIRNREVIERRRRKVRIKRLYRLALFLLDLTHIRDRVRSQGWVEDAAVSRVFPSTLEVRVRERSPVAIAAISGKMWLVDDSGDRIAPYRASEGAFDLPFLTGIGEEDAQDPIELGLHALSAVAECDPGLAGRISEISCRGETARVIFQDATPALVIGSENLVERIRFYLDIRKDLGEHFSRIDYVDVRFAPKLFLRGEFRMDAPQTQGSAAPAAGTEGGLKHG